MNNKEKKKAKKISAKQIIIISAVTLAAFILTALLLAMPELSAASKLSSLKKAVKNSDGGSIVIYQHTPFETGTFEQISQVLEKRLDEAEADIFKELLLSSLSKAKFSSLGEGYYDMTDYKIVITKNGERTVFYISRDSVYLLDGSMMTAFSDDGNEVFDYLDKLKKEHFEK